MDLTSSWHLVWIYKVLNFGIAKERWLAQSQAQNIKMVIVGDGESVWLSRIQTGLWPRSVFPRINSDVSVGKEQGKITGRRGLASTVLVYKIAGALAAQGWDLGFKFHSPTCLVAYLTSHIIWSWSLQCLPESSSRTCSIYCRPIRYHRCGTWALSPSRLKTGWWTPPAWNWWGRIGNGHTCSPSFTKHTLSTIRWVNRLW